MVKIAKFMLCTFYHNQKKKKKKPQCFQRKKPNQGLEQNCAPGEGQLLSLE